MKKSLVLLFLLSCSSMLFAGDRGPSTPEERDRFVKIVKAVEQAPLSENLRRDREWALKFLIEVPDVHADVCANIVPALLEKKAKKKYSSDLAVLMMLSAGVFDIENPEKANDKQAMFQASLESGLRGYEAIVKADPKAKWDVLDALLEKRDKGQLGPYVASQCSGNELHETKVEAK